MGRCLGGGYDLHGFRQDGLFAVRSHNLPARKWQGELYVCSLCPYRGEAFGDVLNIYHNEIRTLKSSTAQNKPPDSHLKHLLDQTLPRDIHCAPSRCPIVWIRWPPYSHPEARQPSQVPSYSTQNQRSAMSLSVARLVMSSMTAPHPFKFNSPYHRTAAVRQTTVTARTRTVAPSAQLATFSNKAVCVQVDDSRRWLVRPSLGIHG